MTDIIRELEAEQIKDQSIPDFAPGDTVVVQVKVREGSRQRLQAFEGLVIARRNRERAPLVPFLLVTVNMAMRQAIGYLSCCELIT